MIVFLIAVLAAAILYAVVMGAGPKKKRPYRNAASSRGSYGIVDSTEVKARWQTITASAASGPAGLKNAVTDADKLTDHVLKQLGLPGDTMGERLKAAQSRFVERDVYNALWRAHKLRNSMAHDIGFDLVPSQAKDALADFARALIALGAL